MAENTEILLGVAIVGLMVLAYLSITTLSKIALGNVGPQPYRQTPEQYFRR